MSLRSRAHCSLLFLFVVSCTTPEGKSPHDAGGTSDGSPDTPQDDGGGSADDAGGSGPSKQARVLSVAPPYAVAEESYNYRPKASSAEKALWKLDQGPVGARMSEDGTTVEWQPSSEQKGRHDLSISAKVEGHDLSQSGQITVGVPEERAALDLDEKAGGSVVVTAPKSKVRGAGLAVRPAGLKQQTRLRISEVDNAPDMAMAKDAPRAVHFGPSGTVFNEAALISLPLPEGESIDKGRVGAFVYNAKGRWERVPVVAVDAEQGLVHAKAKHFSMYAAAQSKLALELSLSRAAESGDCAGSLSVGAWLKEQLNEIDPAQVGNLPAELAARVQGADLAALLASEGVSGSFRFVRVVELGEGEGDARVVLDTRLLVTTLYLPGDGRVLVTHSNALGNALASFEFDDARNALSDLWLHASGRATRAVFAAAPAGQPSASARMHLVYFEGDASLDPISSDDLGFAVVDADVFAAEPSNDASDTDLDCDGLVKAFDPVDNRLMPSIAAQPEGVVATSVGSSVRLSAALAHAAHAPELSWQLLAGSAALNAVDGSPSERDFVPTEAGRYLVMASADFEGETLSYVFAIDVLERTPLPLCTPTPASASLKQGDSVALDAVLGETSLPTSALDVQWGLWVDGELTNSAELVGRGASAGFTPAYASRYRLACRVSHGSELGELGTTDIDVLPAQSNLPPRDLRISPSAATILVGESLSLLAGGSDPEGQSLRFSWSAKGGQLGAPQSQQSESRCAFSADTAGLYELRVAIRDESEIAQEVSAFVLVVAQAADAEGSDADNDGWPAPLDCDDANAKVHPGAADRCGDAIDDDCSGSAKQSDCDDDGVTSEAGDCDDSSREIHPGAAERCDGRDNDCDGQVDEDFKVGTSCSVGRGACTASASWACSADGFSAVCPAQAQKPKSELCDGVDNDCDGSVDEDYVARATQCGLGACAAKGVTACVAGKEQDSCRAGTAAASDATCDRVDDDCNGQVDEDFIHLAEVCNGRDDNCDGHIDEGLSCAGRNVPGCVPKGVETCDAQDDDCDGYFDEDNVCGVIPTTDGGLLGVFWDCADAACSTLGDGGMMFLPGGTALKLESFDHMPYDPSAGPYCGSGSFQYSVVAGDQLSVSWLDDGSVQRSAQGTLIVAGAHASVHWTSGPADMLGTTDELVHIPEQPGGSCPQGPVCQAREVCGNGFDDDCDGHPDPVDPDCLAKCGGSSSPEICDQLDNDCNGAIDDLKQNCQRPDQQGVCQAGKLVCPASGSQPVCQPGSPDPLGEACGDGVDNDCDGQTDETGCVPLTPGESCFNAVDVTQGGVFDFAKGTRNDVTGGCGPDNYVDRVFVINTPQGLGAQYSIWLEGSAKLDVFGTLYQVPGYVAGQACPPLAGSGGMCIGPRFAQGPMLQSGSTYLLVVEAPPDAMTTGGTFTLSVARNNDGICTPSDGDGDGVSICAGDCNDKLNAIHPGASELCNQIDDDCDGQVDEQDGTCQTGQPGACATGLTACGQTPACQPIQHSSADYCGDAVDNDCNGAVDDNCVSAPGEACTNAIDVGNGGAFSGNLVGAADDALSRCGGSGPEHFYRFSVPAGGSYVTLGLRNYNNVRYVLYRDCTLQIVQCGFKSTYLDAGTYLLAVEADMGAAQPYAFTLGLGNSEVCLTPDVDGDGSTACAGDCDESSAAVHPGATEGSTCDGIDNDCNGRPDDVQGSCTLPNLNGVCAQGQVQCSPQGAPSCMQTRFPDPQGRDICGDGLDNDCDGAADAQDPQLCTTVPAGDVCGLPSQPDLSAGGTFAGTLVGYGDDVSLGCGDAGTSAVERFYGFTLSQHKVVTIELRAADAAGDVGYLSMVLLSSCAQQQATSCGTGYMTFELDPGSYTLGVFGGAARSYTLLFSTHDVGDYEGTTCMPADTDHDGYTLCNGDCREGDANTRPGGTEVCDGIDNDCNGQVDENLPSSPCNVQGGVGECAHGQYGCFAGSIQCRGPQPGDSPELCADGKDNDCDGMADDSGQPGVSCVLADGETCQSAKPIQPNGFWSGTLTGAKNDGNGCYGGTQGTAAERYYRFDVPQPGYYYLQVQPVGTGPFPPFAAGIYSGACGMNMANDGCNGPNTNVAYYYLSTPGPHYVVVEADTAFDFRIGLALDGATACSAPDVDGDGATLCSFDCAEGNPGVYPGATELCNGVDDNCNDTVDEGC